MSPGSAGRRRNQRPAATAAWRLAAGMILLVLATRAPADLLEDIETRTEQGVGEVRLQFSVPVRYIKHFPAEHGELLKIYLQTAGLDDPAANELSGYKRAPAQLPVPSYAITYTTARNCYAVREPLCLDIQFSKAVNFRLRPGEDGRSLLILILPEAGVPQAPARP